MMFAVGCIQAQRCHANTCPTGVTTQDPRRARALDVGDKSVRVQRLQAATVASALQIMASMGVADPDQLRPHMLQRRVDPYTLRSLDEMYECLAPGQLLAEPPRPGPPTGKLPTPTTSLSDQEDPVTRTVARLIGDALSELGVRQVFGVVGDALNPLTEAIRTTEDVEWVGCRHEETAAFAASAQSQLSGNLGVCMGTVGPGSIHLLNGLYDAAKSRTPVLAIAGQVPLTDMGSDYFQEVDNDALFSDVAVFRATISSPTSCRNCSRPPFATLWGVRGLPFSPCRATSATGS